MLQIISPIDVYRDQKLQMADEFGSASKLSSENKKRDFAEKFSKKDEKPTIQDLLKGGYSYPEAQELMLRQEDRNIKHEAIAGKLKGQKGQPSKEDIQKFEDDLVKRGMPRAVARMYVTSTPGGQTKIMDDWLKRRERLGDYDSSEEEMGSIKSIDKESPYKVEDSASIFEENEKATPKQPTNKKADFDKGTTPKERIARENDRYARGLPIYEDLVDEIHGFDGIKYSLDVLEDINNTGKLPFGLERINVDPQTGDLKLPAAASEDAQLYVKNVNSFVSKAKDTFGSKITDFDVRSFMKQFPTLANTEGGRKLMLKQMKAVNELNLLEKNALKNTIEEYGGIRKIDIDQARRIAHESIKEEIKQAKEKMKFYNLKIEAEMGKAKKSSDNAYPKEAPKGTVKMTREGKIYNIPEEELNNALQEGFVQQ